MEALSHRPAANLALELGILGKFEYSMDMDIEFLYTDFRTTSPRASQILNF